MDEAHLLDWELLEEVRLLTNLETSQHKLVQMVLVGQPELDERLDSPELRQLKQRVSLRCQLKPLSIRTATRLHPVAGSNFAGANSHSELIFSKEAIEEIYDFSRGIPRMVNNLCESSLMSGYGKQTKQITVEIVREAAADLRVTQASTTSIPGRSGVAMMAL